jgi:uncharacterized membrane protein YdjX (TVP38/TMEM64 family)
MIEGLTALITSQGWLAPAWYVAGFLLAAIVPVIPTPLIAALGGTAFGTVPAILYGLVGLALGAGLALLLSRQLGRRVMRVLIPEKVWREWEVLLGIRSLAAWFAVFLVLNMDIAVMAAGLSSLSARSLWLTAMAARLPWLIVAAWAGETLLVNDAALILVALVMVPVVWGLNRVRPALRRRLARWAEAKQPRDLAGVDPAVAIGPRDGSGDSRAEPPDPAQDDAGALRGDGSDPVHGRS